MTDKTPRMSLAEWKRMKEKPQRNKYRAQSTLVDGLHFPSKLEAAVWCELQHIRRRDGVILNILRYPSVKLPGGVTWKIDFHVSLSESGWEYHEAKGVETADYKVKLKLYREFGDRPLHIWKGSARKVFVAETVIPKNLQGEK